MASRLKSRPAAAAWEQADPANLILKCMEFDLPLYAVQRLANGTWLVRNPLGDPIWPAVDVVAVIDEQASAAPRPARVARPLASLEQAYGAPVGRRKGPRRWL